MGNVSTVPEPRHEIVETTERFMTEEVRLAGAPKQEPEKPRDNGRAAEEAETQRTREVEKRVAQLKAEAEVLKSVHKQRCEAESAQLLECYRKGDGDVCAKHVQLYADCTGKSHA